jgi:predicted metal-dependent hydrolase
VQAPRRLVEYVVVHELVHLVHQEHSREYWAKLGRVMPDYDVRREQLRHAGERLVW